MTSRLDRKITSQLETCGYKPIKRIGAGTFGYVYNVNNAIGDTFAIKYVLDNVGYQEHGLIGLNEIDILSRVHHPHIIHAAEILTRYDCHIDNVAIVLPLATQTLSDFAFRRNTTTEDKLPILYKLATALEFMHRTNILHLDIKSINVVLVDDHPYFIDFGTSRVVPDAIKGYLDTEERVTITARAPELFKSRFKTYNAAVDIWSFGIMMLYVLSAKSMFNIDFDDIDDEIFYEHQLKLFSNPDTIPQLLEGIADKYRDLAIDLITKILQLDPQVRLAADQIVNHPLFDSVSIPIYGTLDVPTINYDYAPDYKENLQLMLTWILSLYPSQEAQLLFLAVDLLARTSAYYKEETSLKRKIIAATCLWIADKIVNTDPIELSDYTLVLINTIPQLTNKDILRMELEIIHLLKGVLNVSALYTACDDFDELKLSFSEVILADDPTFYARIDISEWIATMKKTIKYDYPLKSGRIKRLFV